MKIVSGKFKGRILFRPEDDSIRPTSNRAREMIFNTLNSFFLKDNKSLSNLKVLDCFCGTGALGIEAISQGANDVIFIDNSRKAIEICKRNCKELKIEESAKIIQSDFIKEKRQYLIDIFLCDPPYNKYPIEILLNRLKTIVRVGTYGVIELPKSLNTIEFHDFHLLKKKYVSNSQFCFVKKI